MNSSDAAPKLPVSVLTGFLGSGKTTLLAHLVRHPDFSRTAVIINEFGEVGLDHELITTSEESFIELQTGCLCCSIRSDLVRTLEEMLRSRDAGTLPPFQRIVIETSGLADPAPLLQSIMTNAGIATRLALNGVVTTVDAVNGLATLDTYGESVKQVAVADRLLITKLDLSGGIDSALQGRLAALNPSARQLIADHGRIDPKELFDDAAYDASGNIRDVVRWLASEVANSAPAPHRHQSGILCHTILREAPLPAIALTLFLEIIAEHFGGDLLRLKGIVNIAESPDRPAVIHGVQHVFHPPAWLDHWPSADRRSRLVVISRGVPSALFETLLDALDTEVCEVTSKRRAADIAHREEQHE
jgi:G3E family GTPase